MKCYQHHERDAVGTCAACQAGGCRECLTHYVNAKMCWGCAQQAYYHRVGEINAQGEWAKKRLIRAAIVAVVFGAIGFLMSGLMALGNGIVAAIAASIFGALWCGYVWGTAYLGIPPFIRFFGSRMTGGAISSSPTGALFGALWFWVVAGWWMTFLAWIFAFCGGGLWQIFSLFRTMRRSSTDAASIPPPAPSFAQAAYLAPSVPA